MSFRNAVLLFGLTFSLVLLATWWLMKGEKIKSETANVPIPGKWCQENGDLEVTLSADMTYSLVNADSSFNLNDTGRYWHVTGNFEGQEVVFRNFKKRPSVNGNEYGDWHLPLSVSKGKLAILFGIDPEMLLRKCE